MNSWYKIKAQADTSTAEIYLYDEIGGYGVNAAQFIMDLAEIEADEITVHINSIGGEVFEGFAIYQALKDHRATINVTVDALAASIASVIAMAGDEVTMSRNAQIMIHDGHVQMAGNAAEMTKMVAMLDRVSDNIASVYAERCGGEPAEWRDAMRAESWYNAEEAVAAGLADKVAAGTRRRARNVADLRIFNYKGREFSPAPSIVGTAKEPYGDVEYADPGYQADGKKRYPIDTEEHVRAAWSYVNQGDNASQYSAEQLAHVKGKIKAAAKKFGIEISDSIVPFTWDAKKFLEALKEATEDE